MKIVMIGEAANHRSRLEGRNDLILGLPREAAHSAAFDDRIDGADVVVTLRYGRSGPGPRFRMLHVPGAGLDGIDMASLPPGCALCNVFEHDIPIAEFVLLAMLEWQIRLGELRTRVTPALWSDAYRHRTPHGEIFGRTLGLIGFGRIGRAIAVRARACGIRVLAVDPAGGDGAGLAEILAPAELPLLLAESDFVTIACPLTAATRGLLDAERLRMMRPSAVLINVSRAEIADEAALYAALEGGVIAGAFLDVWYRYPAGDDDDVPPSRFPFHMLQQVTATPHSCAWTDALPGRRYAVIAENIRRLAAGEALLNLVAVVPDGPAVSA